MALRIEMLSPRAQRLTALAALVGAMLLLSGLLLLPYLAIVGSYDGQLQAISDKLHRYRTSVQQMTNIQEQQRRLQRIERATGYSLGGDRPALAAAELQRRVKQVIEQQGGAVVSSQVLGEKTERGMQQITVRVTMRAGIEALGKILHGLESQPPVLMFDNVHIGSRPGGTSRWRGSTSAQELDVRLDVIGFRRGAEAPPEG